MRCAAPSLLALLLLVASADAFLLPANGPRSLSRARPSAQKLAPISVTMALDSEVPNVDFRLAGSLLVLGPLMIAAPWLLGGFFTLLGLLICVQTFRIRFVFDEEAFEVKTLDLTDIDLSKIFSSEVALGTTGENFAVGGENRWKYDSFVNWEFFPSKDLPVLVYFKETQTPADKWDVGPGQMANSPEAQAKGAVPGQVHFFPCIANAEQLKEQFEARGCAKL